MVEEQALIIDVILLVRVWILKRKIEEKYI